MARSVGVRNTVPMLAALAGSILPDFDMLFFHFVDNKSFHHHYYWVHIPLFWMVLATFTLPLAWILGHLRLGLLFFGAIFLHLLLDTIGGGILWGAPFSDHLFSFVTVPAIHSNWVVSFMLHWTFVLEVVIWGVALWLALKPKTRI